MFCHKDYLDFVVPDAGVDFDNAVERVRHRRYVDLALRGHVGKARRRDLRQNRRQQRIGARIEVGQIFYFGTKYS